MRYGRHSRGWLLRLIASASLELSFGGRWKSDFDWSSLELSLKRLARADQDALQPHFQGPQRLLKSQMIGLILSVPRTTGDHLSGLANR